MKLEIFTLCEAATVSGGRLNILGAFDRIFANKTPITHATCAIAIRIRFENIEIGTKKIRISFINTDGKRVLPTIEQTCTVKKDANELSSILSLVLLIQQIKLNDFGTYSIDLAVDGRLEGSIPLYVIRRSG